VVSVGATDATHRVASRVIDKIMVAIEVSPSVAQTVPPMCASAHLNSRGMPGRFHKGGISAANGCEASIPAYMTFL